MLSCQTENPAFAFALRACMAFLLGNWRVFGARLQLRNPFLRPISHEGTANSIARWGVVLFNQSAESRSVFLL